jgi:hypothetical protein
VVALEEQIEGQKARLEELEAALQRKAEATTEALKEEGSEAECRRRVTCRRVRVDAAEAQDEPERASIRKGQLTSDRSEAHQNRRIDSTGVTEGERVRPYRPARKKKVTRHRPDRQRGPPGPHQSEDDSVGRLAPYLWGCSGRAALRRGQCYILGFPW